MSTGFTAVGDKRTFHNRDGRTITRSFDVPTEFAGNTVDARARYEPTDTRVAIRTNLSDIYRTDGDKSLTIRSLKGKCRLIHYETDLNGKEHQTCVSTKGKVSYLPIHSKVSLCFFIDSDKPTSTFKGDLLARKLMVYRRDHPWTYLDALNFEVTARGTVNSHDGTITVDPNKFDITVVVESQEESILQTLNRWLHCQRLPLPPVRDVTGSHYLEKRVRQTRKAERDSRSYRSEDTRRRSVATKSLKELGKGD